MKNLICITLVIFSITAFCNAGVSIASQLSNGEITPEDIPSVYQNYLHLMAGKIHSSDSERYNLFKNNVLDIVNHNNNPTFTYKRVINQYTGLLWNEIVGTAIMETQDCKSTLKSPVTIRAPIESIPSSFDWRDTGIITPVKDQKLCGSCWAFAATGALEAFWALYTGVAPVSLSEQQLIDCSDSFENSGCDGGLPSNAFKYIQNQGGLNTENTYPYEAMDDTCRYNQYSNGAKAFSGSINIAQGDENGILSTLLNVGPVAIALQVQADFLTYDSGIYTSTTCSSSASTVNHAALIVGYGTDATTGMDYWIVKNSWGTMWGQEGYFFIERGVNMCGIAECASYPNMTGENPLSASFENLFLA